MSAANITTLESDSEYNDLSKFDDKTLELTDQPTRDMVRLQLEAYEKFLRRLVGRSDAPSLPAGHTAKVYNCTHTLSFVCLKIVGLYIGL